MITTQKTLDALKTIGLIIDWKMKTYRDGDLKWESPVIISDNISISNETYGKESFLYFSTKTAELAKEIAKVLSTIGGKPDFGWRSDNPSCFALQVSSFNGFHWWE